MPLLDFVRNAAIRGHFQKRQNMHGVMTGKRGNKNFSKGHGGRTVGVHTDLGGYVIRPRMLLDLQVPDLRVATLKPYVAHRNTVPAAK